MCITKEQEDFYLYVEALAKDAERYRWLRANDMWDMHDICGSSGFGVENAIGEELDAAIDKAMAAPKTT